MLYYCLKARNFLSYASIGIDEFRELSGSSPLEVDKKYFSIKDKLHKIKASSIEQDVFAYFVSIERNYSTDKPGVDFDTYIKDNLSIEINTALS